MPTEIRIAGAQIPVTREIETNVETICRAIEFAAGEKADILLTPEGSLSGYTNEFDPDAARAGLERVTSDAKGAGVGLALGTCFLEPDDGKCYNQIRFYEPDGEYLGFHSKTLLCGSLDDPPQGEINRYEISPLRTFRFGDLEIAALICNDLWANPMCTPMPDPYLTQKLSKMGARIIFQAVNGGSRDTTEWCGMVRGFHESNLRMRARASHLWIVTVDNCHPTDRPCSAPSGVIDSEGAWVLRAEPQGEQLFAHTIEVPDES